MAVSLSPIFRYVPPKLFRRDAYSGECRPRSLRSRELTKKHETAFQTTLSDAVDYYTANPPKGECVIVMEGRSRAELQKEAQMRWEELSVSEHVAHYIESGMDRKEAMKQAAKDRGVSKREIYAALLEAEQE